jgi:DNA primase large subunit
MPITIEKVNIKEFTDNVVRDDVDFIVTGSGIFDTMMETATEHLKTQFEGNRIREEDYAAAYIEIYKTTLQAALQAWLQKGVAEAEIAAKLAEIPLKEKQLELLEKQLDLLGKQVEAETAKAALHRRQIEAFDEDYKHKLLKVLMDAWSVGFSVAKDSFEAVGIPATMQKVTIDDLYNTYIKQDLDAYKYKRESSMLES